MLRRTATTIKLTPEDILEYDDNLAKAAQEYPYNQGISNNDEQDHSILKFKDLPEESLTRDERIGIMRQGRQVSQGPSQNQSLQQQQPQQHQQ
ncbi:hypothetical protein CLIB1423_11S03312 [[Candida] railenensis]|uniref:Uncharacterized protein n=1 Tax=[Candida] railenensis TaxID=45579 RepID=A0A9P0QQE7_9ASCO|nr:hypothetical protein CLIB1423_11S03312 [[Candida] railenensis]